MVCPYFYASTFLISCIKITCSGFANFTLPTHITLQFYLYLYLAMGLGWMCSELWYTVYRHPTGMVEDKKNNVDSKKESLSSQEQFQYCLLSILILLPLRMAFSISNKRVLMILPISGYWVAFKLKCSHDTRNILSFPLILLLSSPFPTVQKILRQESWYWIKKCFF